MSFSPWHLRIKAKRDSAGACDYSIRGRGTDRWMLGTPWPTSLVKTASFPSSEEPCLTGMSQRVIEEAIQHLLLALSELCMGICICTLVCVPHTHIPIPHTTCTCTCTYTGDGGRYVTCPHLPNFVSHNTVGSSFHSRE